MAISLRTLRATCIAAALLMAVSVLHVNADPTPPPPRLPICGDQSEQGAILERCANLTPLPNVQTFTVAGETDVRLEFNFVFRQATLPNELGFFVVDDADGSVAGIEPAADGYLQEALSRAVTIFPSGSDAFTADVSRSISNGSILLFFVVEGGSLSDVRANNRENRPGAEPVLLFSWDSLNPDGDDHFVGFRDESERFVQFGFEDLLGGGDRDYDDVVYNISTDASGTLKATTRPGGGNALARNIAIAGLVLCAFVAAGGVYWFRVRPWLWGRGPGRSRSRRRGGGPITSGHLVFSGSQPASSLPVGQPSLEHVGEASDVYYPLGEAISVALEGGVELVRISRSGQGYLLHCIDRSGAVRFAGRPAAEWVRLQDGDTVEIGADRIALHTPDRQ